MDLDNLGYAQFSYLNEVYNQMEHGYQDGSGWHCGNLVGLGGEYSSLDVDGNNNVHLTHFLLSSTQADKPDYAVKSSSNWVHAEVKTAASGGRYSSLAFNN